MLIYVSENSDVLFRNGEKYIDFQPDNEVGCPEGLEPRTLYPNKYCKDNFHLTENSTLVLSDTNKYEKRIYQVNEFCVALNGNAKRKDDHFATICMDVKEKNFRMT